MVGDYTCSLTERGMVVCPFFKISPGAKLEALSLGTRTLRGPSKTAYVPPKWFPLQNSRPSMCLASIRSASSSRLTSGERRWVQQSWISGPGMQVALSSSSSCPLTPAQPASLCSDESCLPLPAIPAW